MQPGSSAGSASEVNPSLQFAISVLSAGPVTPGDGVGFSDAALIARTHMASGRLLQPSRAATAIDACECARGRGGCSCCTRRNTLVSRCLRPSPAIVGRVFPDAPGALPAGEVYATYSAVGGRTWDHVLAAALPAPYALVSSSQPPAALLLVRVPAWRGRHRLLPPSLPPQPPAALLGTRADRASRAWLQPPAAAASPAAAGGDIGVVAYSLNATTLDNATLAVQARGGERGGRRLY